MKEIDWIILVTLHDVQNITNTAKKLFISQPALTRRLQRMEEKLNTRLIVRTNKGISFTPNGEYVVKVAKEILKNIENINEFIQQSQEGNEGHLKVGVPNSFMNFIVPSLIKKTAEIYPDITLEFVSGLSSDLIKLVSNGTLDLCFARGSTDNKLDKVMLSEDQVFLISCKPINIDELDKHVYVDFIKESTIIEETKRWWTERFDTDLVAKYIVNNGGACLQLIKEEIGFGIFPDKNYLEDNQVFVGVPLKFKDGTPFTRKSWLVYQKDFKIFPTLTNFINLIKEYYDEFSELRG